MLAKLKIKHNANPKFKFEKEFDQDTIRIGRDADQNEVHLPGRAISGKHAVITRQGDRFELSDLSKNGTLLNGGKLKGDKAYDLKNGAQIAVIDYLIEFEIIAIGNGNAAVVAQSTLPLQNPFFREAQKLSELFNKISEKYAVAESASRDDSLRDALQATFRQTANSPALTIILEVLQNGQSRLQSSNGAKREKTEGLATQFEKAFDFDQLGETPTQPEEPLIKKPVRPDISFVDFGSMVIAPEPAPDISAITGSASPAKASNQVDRLNLTVDLLLDAAIKMIAGRRDFGINYLDETKKGNRKRQKDELLDIYSCTWEELKDYLHDEMISGKEADLRLAQLKRALKDLTEHQRSLMLAYRRSTAEGSKKLLNALSPTALEAETDSGILPFLTQAKLWKFYQSKHEAVMAEIDRTFTDFERKYFLEAFVKGYKAKSFD